MCVSCLSCPQVTRLPTLANWKIRLVKTCPLDIHAWSVSHVIVIDTVAYQLTGPWPFCQSFWHYRLIEDWHIDFQWLFHLRLWRNTFGYPAKLNSKAIFNLSDEPSVHATWSGGGPGRLPGMRRNSKLWSPKRNRYLLDKEILEAFGVPVSEQCARQCGIQPYVIPADVPLSEVVGFLDQSGFKI